MGTPRYFTMRKSFQGPYMHEHSQDRRPPMRETVRDIDKQILALLVQRTNVLSRMAKGARHITAQDERFLREAWEAQASKVSADPLVTHRLFGMLQEIEFLPPPSEESGPRRKSYNLAPQQSPVRIDMDAPKNHRQVRLWSVLAAFSGSPLRIDKALVNDAVVDCLHLMNEMGASLIRDEGDIRQDATCSPAGTPDKILHVGDSALNFYLALAHYLGRPGHAKFSGGSSLRLADFSSIRHFLPEMGARLIPLVPKSDGLPLRVECSGELPEVVRVPDDLPIDFVLALLVSAPFYEKGLKMDLGRREEGPDGEYLGRLFRVMENAGCDYCRDGNVIQVRSYHGMLPRQPRVGMDLELSTLLLALGMALGGEVTLHGEWPVSIPAKAVEEFFASLGCPIAIDGGKIALKLEGSIGDAPIKVSPGFPRGLMPLAYAAACLQALRLGKAFVPEGLDEKTLEEGRSFARACHLEIDGEVIRKASEEEETRVVWTAPDPMWVHALAIAACGREKDGFALNNPGLLTEYYPPFWSIYNALPSPSARVEKAAGTDGNAGKERRRIRTQSTAKIAPLPEDEE